MARRPAKKPTPEAEALFELVIEVPRTFFLLRALGKQVGAVTNWGAGLWGFLRTLKLEGPKTVPQIARLRPVARQLIQTLADEAAAEGLVEFIDNPHHKRSKLVCLTAKGEARYAELTARIMAGCVELANGLDATKLRHATSTLTAIRERLAKRVGAA
jgi:DNA-binding MarR family transcriptional regulator